MPKEGKEEKDEKEEKKDGKGGAAQQEVITISSYCCVKWMHDDDGICACDVLAIFAYVIKWCTRSR